MNEVIITPLDQQIARVLIANPNNKDEIIQGLISLLRTKQQIIDAMESANAHENKADGTWRLTTLRN